METKNKIILKNQLLNLMQIGEWKGFVDFVLEEGSHVVNIKKINGYTLLSCASECGDKKIVEYLMQNGAKSNATNFDRSIPLHIAAKHGHVDIVEFFLNLSICVDSRDCLKRTPLHYVTDQLSSNEDHPPVLISGYDKVSYDAVMVGPCSSQVHNELVSLLLSHGADINTTDSLGNFPLTNAVMHNCPDVVEMLIRRGADVELLDEDQWTVLHYASYFGWLNVVQRLLERRVDLNPETLLGDTPLLMAAKRSHKEVVELLVKSGANVSSRGMLKTTSLHYASREGWLGVVQLIVEREADINARTCSGATPVMLAVKHEHSDVFDYLVKCGASLVGCEGKTTILHYASKASWVDAVQSLVDLGSDMNGQTREGDTPLLIAASLSCKKICDILITSGASLNIYDSNSCSLLHYACVNGWTDTVQRCVDAGLDINAKTPKDMTPLMLAASRRYCNVTIFNCLLEAGADIRLVKRSLGLTVLHYACDSASLDMVSALLSKGADVNVKSSEGNTPLSIAAHHGNTHIVQNLIKAGADVNVKSTTGHTPLTEAVNCDNTHIVQNLIEAGADVNVKTSKGNTPLTLAFRCGNTDMVKNLIEAGADVNVIYKGYTPLAVAVHRGYMDIALNLLIAGADINVKISNGTTPLYSAISLNNMEMVQLLLKFGANCYEDNGHGTPLECYVNKSNDLKYLPLFIEKGAFITNNLNDTLMNNSYFKERILKNLGVCKQIILNKFNNSDLPKIYQVPFAVKNLPPMKGMKIATKRYVAQCIEESVVRDIKKNGFCDISVMKPIVLSFLSAKAFIDHCT